MSEETITFTKLIFFIGFDKDYELNDTIDSVCDILKQNKEYTDVNIQILFSSDKESLTKKKILDINECIIKTELINITIIYDVDLEKLKYHINESPEENVCVRFFCHGQQGIRDVIGEPVSYMEYTYDNTKKHIDRNDFTDLVETKYIFFTFCSCQTSSFFTKRTIKSNFFALQRNVCKNEQIKTCNDFYISSDMVLVIKYSAAKYGYTLLYDDMNKNNLLQFVMVIMINAINQEIVDSDDEQDGGNKTRKSKTRKSKKLKS